MATLLPRCSRCEQPIPPGEGITVYRWPYGGGVPVLAHRACADRPDPVTNRPDPVARDIAALIAYFALFQGVILVVMATMDNGPWWLFLPAMLVFATMTIGWYVNSIRY